MEQAQLHFAFGVHIHQPVGNFAAVIQRAHDRAYAPFFQTVSQYPGVRFSLHISGSLLEWMEANTRETLAVIKALVKRGQCEILSGTYYEALAPVAPRRDVVASVRAYSAKLKRVFGVRPEGMWLAERVYEPSLPEILNAAGMRFLPLDDWHFHVVGMRGAELEKPWLLEYQGAVVTALPISQTLRYLVPFAPIDEVINFLKQSYDRGASLACLADDGEKFGEWPGTCDHCYRNGWLASFFERLEQEKSWLRTVPLGEAVATLPASGPVYLTATSYYEMGRWALTTEQKQELADLGQRIGADLFGNEAPASITRLIPGGIFRNFLRKYEEVNFFHKRVQKASREFYANRGRLGDRRRPVQDALWRAEANDSYWHGVFGGFYLPHLRRAAKRALIVAETEMDGVLGKSQSEDISDFDCDGGKELTWKTENLIAVLKLAEGLTVAELSLRSPPVTVTDVPARRPEYYHRLLDAVVSAGVERAVTIHRPLPAKEEALHSYLTYDRRPKRLFMERIFQTDGYENDVLAAAYAAEKLGELGPVIWELPVRGDDGWSATGAARCPSGKIKLIKSISAKPAGLVYNLKLASESVSPVTVGVELPFGLTAGAGQVTVEGGESFGSESPCAVGPHRTFSVSDGVTGWQVRIEVEPALPVWLAPVYTVSCSECGFEKVFQGAVLCFWLTLPGKGVHEEIAISLEAVTGDF